MADNPSTYCEDQVRRLDHDRYLCALFAPPGDRPRLMALYAFNLEAARVREVVSEPVMGQIRLQWWRDALAEIAAGQVRAHPVAQALALALAGRTVRADLFERLLSAREFDLGDAPPADMAALETYAADTSSSLLQIGLDFLGVADPAADEAAHHVGVAWSLVGLLRALPFHARQRRLYLPETLLTKANIDREQFFAGRAGQGLRDITRQIADHATERLARGRAHRRIISRAARAVFLPATLADVHLGRLARAGYDPFAPALQRPRGGDALRLSWASLRNRY